MYIYISLFFNCLLFTCLWIIYSYIHTLYYIHTYGYTWIPISSLIVFLTRSPNPCVLALQRLQTPAAKVHNDDKRDHRSTSIANLEQWFSMYLGRTDGREWTWNLMNKVLCNIVYPSNRVVYSMTHGMNLRIHRKTAIPGLSPIQRHTEKPSRIKIDQNATSWNCALFPP